MEKSDVVQPNKSDKNNKQTGIVYELQIKYLVKNNINIKTCQ